MTYVHNCRDCGKDFASGYLLDDRCPACRRGVLSDVPPVPGVGDPYAHGRQT